MKKVLITGISGQDGIFLAKKFLESNSDTILYGVSRNIKSVHKKLKYLNPNLNKNNLNLISMDLMDSKKCSELLIDMNFDEIYNLSGPSNVYESLKYPKLIKEQITKIFNNLTETIIQNNIQTNFFQASSSEMYGKYIKGKLDENSLFNPNSAYAEAKLLNHMKILEYSQDYKWCITSGIMFNHESEFRDSSFLFMKIINTAIEIHKNHTGKLLLGSLEYKRDWSYAEDIVNAIYLINQNPKSKTYVIGSGKSHSIKQLVELVFQEFNLNYKNYIEIDENLLRKDDSHEICSNPLKLEEDYGWKPKYHFEDFVKKILNYKVKNL